MRSSTVLIAATWCACAAGCGRLADGGYRGEPVAELTGTLQRAEPVAGNVSISLSWYPAAAHDALLNVAGGGAQATVTTTCTALEPETPPECAAMQPAQGRTVCRETNDLSDLPLPPVTYEPRLPLTFRLPIHDLPPQGARYDLAQQGGRGTFALGAVIAFVDEDGDGAFRRGTPEESPEVGLADSAYPSRAPPPGTPRRAYLVAFLDGAIDAASVSAPQAGVLAALPQGYSVWLTEEWFDEYDRSIGVRRSAQPVSRAIELLSDASTPLGPSWCRELVADRAWVPFIPGGAQPTWCSDDGLEVRWGPSLVPTGVCAYRGEQYHADFRCLGFLPPGPIQCLPAGSAFVLVTTATTGQFPDLDGYTFGLDGGQPWSIPSNGFVRRDVGPGAHTVALEGLSPNCSARENPLAVSVEPGETAVASFAVECGPGALAVIHGMLPFALPGGAALALSWYAGPSHDGMMNNREFDPVPDPYYSVSTNEVVPVTAPACDGSAATGRELRTETNHLVASIQQPLRILATAGTTFTAEIRDLPPPEARFDLARQGGFGEFALASVRAFSDLDGDGAFGFGTSARPPEPVLADSGFQDYAPEPFAARRSYFIAYLDGYVNVNSIFQPAYGILYALPQGFSVWAKEEWVDPHGRSIDVRRLPRGVETPIELVAAPDIAAWPYWCSEVVFDRTYISEIPGGFFPLDCVYESPLLRAALWHRLTPTAAPCTALDEEYWGDFSCVVDPPVMACPALLGSRRGRIEQRR